MDFIEFLKKESGSSMKPVLSLNKTRAVKNKKQVNDKKKMAVNGNSSLKNISVLLDEVLANLPSDQAAQVAKDYDEFSAEKWNTLHSDAKRAIIIYLKTHQNSFDFNKFKIYYSKEKKQDNFSDEWKLGLSATVIAALFISISLSNYAPSQTEKYTRIIDQSFFGFLNNESSAISVTAEIKNKPKIQRDELEIASAKAMYVIKNQDMLKNQEIVEVKEEELFGQVAGEMEVNVEYASSIPLPPSPPPLPEAPEIKKSAVAQKCKDFFVAMKLEQEKLSQKLQDGLENILK